MKGPLPMSVSPNLALPYILAAQSQKHVTHNEALRALDALLQMSVLDRNLATPPATPLDGDRYIVAASPTGAWVGGANKIAAFQDGAWELYAPKEGWLTWIADENIVVVFDGAAWAALPSGGGATDHGLLAGLADDDHAQYHTNARGDARYVPLAPSTLGINATADTTNRLALASAASLFNHAGAGHQQKINKASAAQTASQLYQSNFSGRAEIGLIGDDDFRFKVSADGTTFFDAIVIDRGTGKVKFPQTPHREVLTAARSYYVRGDGNDSNTGLANASGGAFLTLQRAFDVVGTLDIGIHDVTIEMAAGTYNFAASNKFKQPLGSGQVIVLGDQTTPANVVLNSTANLTASTDGNIVAAGNAAVVLAVRGVRLTNSSSGAHGLHALNNGRIDFQGIEFGGGLGQQVRVADGGIIIATGNYAIVGGAGYHWIAVGTGVIRVQSRTITVSSTPNFTGQFALAGLAGVILCDGNTFSGSATGTRYLADRNGVIGSNGATLPGNAAGSTATGGQYT